MAIMYYRPLVRTEPHISKGSSVWEGYNQGKYNKKDGVQFFVDFIV